ncbi:MAG: phosphotransferase family protein [Cytophagales bacterium]|nr:phosphotransferase family protein [Cytophagales bacterium]
MQTDEPVDSRKGEELDLVKLNVYLQGHAPHLGVVVAQKQFPGGYSNLTYLLMTDTGEFILRRPPFGAAIKSAHDMGREFKVLSLLKDHYQKIPTPLHYCEGVDAIGAPFYIMERLRGIILRPGDVKKIGLAPAEMKKLSEALVDNLVALHAINIYDTGLDQLGKPEGYIQRQVEGWTRRYETAQTDIIEKMDALGEWLMFNQPVDTAPTLLHNDYKYDNVVFREDFSEIIGVLDWEMATVGDPWMDLGASLAYWGEGRDGPLAKVFNISWLPGNMPRTEVVQRYMEKSGRAVDSPVFYYVFGLFKNAVIAQQIYSRWKQGHSTDARFGQLIHVIHDLARRGSEAIDKNAI